MHTAIRIIAQSLSAVCVYSGAVSAYCSCIYVSIAAVRTCVHSAVLHTYVRMCICTDMICAYIGKCIRHVVLCT